MNDDQIKAIFQNSKTIAMIGISSEKKKEDPKMIKRKPANVVMKYLQDFGYKVIPVNPFAEGEIINGETVAASLENISESVDIVDIFRPSKETPNIANEAVKIGSKVLWLQYGIQNEEAKKIAEKANMQYVSNRCIKQEYQRLFQKVNPVFPALKN
jgi:predicted CoA-binding protein